MDNQQGYNSWAANYDTVLNKTRDLEAVALRQTLSRFTFSEVLEIGCGTGKNTGWLLTHAQSVVGMDFSEEMLRKAKEKITAGHVQFKQADIRLAWDLDLHRFDLLTCSLVLEHVQDIDFIFKQAKQVLKAGGLFYISELHPFRQYRGSKARFDTENGVVELECYVHHISDFFQTAQSNGFQCMDLQEWFDNDDKTTLPRLVSLVFRAN
jgi:ubiquinone/menaquinone biosynthesis C-methylase UbiE